MGAGFYGLSDDLETHVLHSNPLQKDVFVEIDWFVFGKRNMKPREGFVRFAKDIFRRAPVSNPDGTQGINLHIDLSDEIPEAPSVLGYYEFYVPESDSWVELEVFDAGSAVNWNANRGLETSVNANLNQDYIYLPGRNVHKFDILRGFEEWTKLVFNGGLIGNQSNKTSSAQALQPRCLSFQEHIQRTAGRLQQNTSGTTTRTVYQGADWQ